MPQYRSSGVHVEEMGQVIGAARWTFQETGKLTDIGAFGEYREVVR
jgi:hypothetical protein